MQFHGWSHDEKNEIHLRLPHTAGVRERFVEFHRVMAHDLLAPARTMKLLTELLERKTDGERPRELELIRAQADELLMTAGRLADYLNLLATPPAFDTIRLEHVLQAVREASPQDRVEVTCPELTVLGDAGLLRSAILELVENAARHSTGPVRIEVTSDEPTVTVVIADEGPGIPPRYHDAVKELGRTLGDGKRVGAGLTIADVAAARHGGSLQIDSDGQHGCRVKLTLSKGIETEEGP